MLLLWLGGIDMRITMLAVPPLVPLIHRELGLDEKQVAALVSLPVLLFAVAAVPGSLLIAKFGVRGALVAGLGVVALFGAMRGLGPSTPVLFGATSLMGIGIAVVQPAFPTLVRAWFPRRIALATAVFSNGFLVGETIPSALTTPVGVLQIAHGDWRWALAFWSVFVAVTAIAIALVAPARGPRPDVPARWWPSWMEGPAVRIGVVMGMASAVYFGTNAFIPDYLDQTHRHNLIPATLAVLNGSQLFTAPAVALWDRVLMGRAGFMGSAVLMVIAQVGIIFTPGAGVIAWAGVIGFSTALGFIVALAMPAKLAAEGDVHRMSAAIFTVQYTVGFVLPLIAGAMWDATGVAALAFVPGLAGAAAMGFLAIGLSLHAAPVAPRPTGVP